MSFKLACDLLDQNAGTIRAAMTAFFLILAVIIVLGA
jgi:predicted nucleic acid-binding Zn ribbon protein